MSVRAAARIGNARLRGDSKGSSDLVFEPGTVTPGNFHFPIGTAGATGLVLHTAYLPLALAKEPSEVIIDGGTHVRASPCFHFLDTTWRAYMALCGLDIRVRMTRTGFYPRGGGQIRAVVEPCPMLRNLQIDRPTPPTHVRGVSAVAGLPPSIAQRQARRATYRLRDTALSVDMHEETWPGGPGTVVLLILNTQPVPTLFYGLGERGKPAERVADDAADQVLAFLAATPAGIDGHSADQILLPLALAEGPSRFPVAEVTQHLLTNAKVIQHFVPRHITISGDEGEPGEVTIG
jgi:RNA 3'-terminal phosphate cyclase (ATP)